MNAEPEQFHVIFAVKPAYHILVALGGDLADQAYLVRGGPAPERTLQTERTDPLPDPVGEASSTQSDAREGMMTSTSDGWPQFIKTFDEWRERRATEDGGTGQLRDETPTSTHRAVDSAWAIAGGTAVFLGSLLPFISFSDPEMGVNPGARAASALFGLIVLGLGIALRAVQRRFLMGTSIATLCLSALGCLGYVITIATGLAGVTEQDPFGDSVKITFSPGIGILLAVAGCAAAVVAGIRSAQHYGS